MKTLRLFLIVYAFIYSQLSAQTELNFDEYFNDQTMRIDYHHTGDVETELITIDQIYQYGIWAGSKINLIDNFNNGRYYVKIYDQSSGILIYSKGFDSYFGEYQTSSNAAEGIKKTYHESAIIPFPKNQIFFTIEKRNKEKKLEEIFRTEIDPKSLEIIRDKILVKSVQVYKSLYNGDSHTKVDIAIIGEGYSKQEQSKFEEDLERFRDIIFKQEPYKSYKDDFNIYGVFKPSEESGVDEPRAGIYKNTILNATFNSLGSERYLLTEDNKSLRNIAAHVPYDALYIMVNHNRYGGGGIYNFYCTFTSDSQFHEYIFLHEFGHSFAGLADEYYTSDVAYNDFYPQGIEPVEPNITALLDKNNIKWKKFLTDEIELPTPWEKEDFDKMDYAWQKERREMNNEIAELKKTHAAEDKILQAENNYASRDKEHSDKVDDYLKKSKYWNKVGAFEGAGYSAKGLYRPMLDCIMFSKGNKPFCKVCEAAIINVINHYSR